MAKQLTRLTVFASGTAETEAERAAIGRVLEELSSVLEKTHGITLRLALFPNTIRPGVNIDAQTEINRQIGDYDIYVGVLGPRFGTPTARAGSGTEEEFQIALARFREDTRSVRVMFYFKRANEDPFMLDMLQLQKVRAFRDGLPGRGVLYLDFNDTPAFIDKLRDNLHHLIIDDWAGDSWRQIEEGAQGVATAAADAVGDEAGGIPSPATPAAGRDDREEVPTGTAPSGDPGTDLAGDETEGEGFGYLDLAEEFEQRLESLNPTLQRIGEHTERIGEQFQEHTRQTELLTEQQKRVEHVGGSRERQEYFSRAKAVVNQAADDLEKYAFEMRKDINAFRIDARALITTLRQLIVSQRELGRTTEREAEDRKAIMRLVDSLETSRQNITRFQTEVARMPTLTAQFKRARKRGTAMLGEFLVEVQFVIAEGKEILADFERQAGEEDVST